jgi:hypothetical protein
MASSGDLTRDAEVILHLPHDPRPVVDWWVSSGAGRALTVRLDGREVQAVAVEEYDYPDDRVAYRIRPADAEGPLIRVWWDDAAMRWGWLPAGQDAREAGQWKDDKQVKRRWWTEHQGWPPIWVHRGGRWREAWLFQREDWPDGTVVYQVGIEREPGQRVEGLEQLRVVYDPRSVQKRRYGVREDGSRV